MLCCLCTLLCIASLYIQYIYPTYQVVLAFQNKQEDLQKWLSVWTYIGMLLFVESYLCFIPLIPGYWLVRTLVILWFYHDEYNGSQYLYEKFISKNVPQIQKLLDHVKFMKIQLNDN
ncbi:TB2 HVA22 family protein, putative [Ichthyophthirius multifiliis]|uniref:TB2 HVA22 family protein, putative n=1 Tax=Ichthyophthirius multifiliis TaxID=5932 RepID=G0QUQ7_ICHMU|nr:TB2 HVA22 family protein, putative [Ichthyophthirius multifiliis]EGR31042.1 TB2 HVA22 family protein, putative [Ichthyophthirius multifiliis]|eukprot:XP_004034528.1 TB2 HVA22 family protein, putative [Ichthyophthirius multifiliis]